MPEAKYAGPERRKYLRLAKRCVIKYTPLSEELKPIVNFIIKSHTLDICAIGVRFASRKKIPAHKIVEFKFKPPGTNVFITGLGKVVRVKVRADRKSYNVSLKFVWVQQKYSALIDRCVRKEKIKQLIKKLDK